jgi:hypothetical protein
MDGAEGHVRAVCVLVRMGELIGARGAISFDRFPGGHTVTGPSTFASAIILRSSKVLPHPESIGLS